MAPFTGVGLATVVAALAVHAQQLQQPTFRAGVDLVQVDAVVLDADGRPVTALTRDDFTLLDRGAPQPIELFREVSHERPPRPIFPETLGLDVSDNVTAAADRLVVIVIDDLHFQGKTDEVKDVARRVVRELGPSASMALLTTSRTIGVEFTEDRTVLLRAIDRFSDKFDPEGRQLHPAVRAAWMGRTNAFVGPTDLGKFFSDQQALRTLDEAAAMLGIENRLRKAFVWISTGLVANPTEVPPDAAREFVRDGKARKRGYEEPEALEGAVNMALHAMQRAGVATYALNPGGYGGNGGFLRYVAEQSGGFVIQPDRIDEGLDRLVSDLDHYYLLGFYPRDADPDDRSVRTLRVRVNRPGTTVRSRFGYMTMPPRPLPRNDNQLVALSSSVMPSTSLPIRLHAAPFPTTGKDARVLLTIEVPTTRAAIDHAQSNGELIDKIEYAVLAADLNKKKVTRNFENHATVTVPAAPASNGAVTFQIVTDLKLPPGPYQLRASAKSTRLNRGGSVYLTFDAPDFTKAPLALGGFVIGYAGKRAADVLTNVEERNLVPFPPVLDREFDRDTTLDVLVPVYRKNARTEIALTLEVVDRNESVVARHEQRIGLGMRPEFRMPVPLASLSPGPYRLRVSAHDGGSDASRELGIVVK